MAGSDSFETSFFYSEDDRYIRAVRSNLIRKNGEVMPGAFKSKKGGVSVTRTNTTVFDNALSYMKSHFEGIMAAFPVRVCRECSIYEEHSPSLGHNLHHWELYGDRNYSQLSDYQIFYLLKNLVLI